MKQLNKSVATSQILVSAAMLLASAGHPASATCSTPFASEAKVEPDTLEKKQGNFIGYPIIFHSPETKLAFGATGGYFYRPAGSDTASRPSTLGATLIYTQKKQIEIGLGVDLYWKKDTHHFSGGIGYSKFPDTFYGIGNNTAEEMAEDYTPQTFGLGLSFQKTVRPSLYSGINYRLSSTKMIKVEENGLLAKGDIPGSEGGFVSSAGLSVNRDTRNNIFWPSSGGFYEISAGLSEKIIGSDFDFTGYRVDLRKYMPIFSSHVLAFQGVMNILSGDPPFQELPELGGVLRGYFAGRYRDKTLLAGQVEYRMPVWWRFGVVGFAGYGDVADKVSHFQRESFKYSLGWGVRYLLNRDERLNLRLDFGYGKGSSQFYLNLTEAF